jgi:hypothetical protein
LAACYRPAGARFLGFGRPQLAEAFVYGFDEFKPPPEPLATAGARVAERANGLFAVGPQFEAELHAICHALIVTAGHLWWHRAAPLRFSRLMATRYVAILSCQPRLRRRCRGSGSEGRPWAPKICWSGTPNWP